MIGHLTGEYICRHGKCQETPPKASIGHRDTGDVQEITSLTNVAVYNEDNAVYAARR